MQFRNEKFFVFLFYFISFYFFVPILICYFLFCNGVWPLFNKRLLTYFRTWPNIAIRLTQILLQMFHCWVWFITDAFVTKSYQRIPRSLRKHRQSQVSVCLILLGSRSPFTVAFDENHRAKNASLSPSNRGITANPKQIEVVETGL